MDVIMDCYFDDVFSKLDRGFLLARYKRRELVEYFSTVIQGCYLGQEQVSTDSACDRAVLSAIRFHNATRDKNGDICLMGKYHNVLYIAAKLAFDWKLTKSRTVSTLLDGMYVCEHTFERLFTGAIIGTKVSHLISGWKSDFDTSEQNLQALVYFCHHSTLCRKEYDGKRFVDVPMESYGRNTAAGLCMQVANPEVLLVLLRFGAQVNPGGDVKNCPLHHLVHRINDIYNRNMRPPPELVYCLKLALRCVVSIPLISIEGDPGVDYINEKFVSELVPDVRSGRTTPELKHLCRVAIRQALNSNFQLPYGVDDLELPGSLRDYINIGCD